MKKRHILFIVMIIIFALAIVNFEDKEKTTTEINITNIEGTLLGKNIWEGNIHITGDVIVSPFATLTIKPGTKIVFEQKDNIKSKYDIEIPADGFNDDDPSRLKEYSDAHSSIIAIGSLIAKGNIENPIIFTSNNKKYADWGGINLVGMPSALEYVVVEYSRNGISVPSNRKEIYVKNSIVKHALWGCFSLRGSNGLYENNLAEDCGHEGFDVNGNARLINNEVKDSHAGIIVFGGQPVIQDNLVQDKIEVVGGNPRLINNKISRTLRCNKNKEWSFERYRIPCEGKPYLIS